MTIFSYTDTYKGTLDEKRENDKRALFPESRRRLFYLILCTLTIIWLLLTIVPNTSTLLSKDQIPFEQASLHERHTMPTILSIVDPTTGTYINSLENVLYQDLKNVQMMEHRFLDTTENLPALKLDKTEMTTFRQSLVLSWTLGQTLGGHPIVDDQDIVALYCPATSDHRSFLEAATIDQIRATSRRVGSTQENEWFIPSFPIIKHESCQFRMFDRQSTDTLQLLGSSPILKLPASRTPTNIHMAYSQDPTEMVIQFNTAEKGTPIAMYGLSNNQMDTKSEGKSHTYTSQDLCGAPANQTEAGKFQPPGFFHVVVLTGLNLNESYSYKVGLASGQGVIWSDIHSFHSSLPVGQHKEPFSYAVYGDQGCPSVGWGEGGEWTAELAAREKGIRSVHHFGDLSYARGASHIWDEWMNMIQSFSTRVPIMVGVGNHEYDHVVGGKGKDPSGVMEDHGFMPEWGNFGYDSGGECGVPTVNRFTMPSSNNSNGIFWYSHNFASVHTIVLSSEHNMTEGSVQHEWMLEDLKSVNRSITPWVIVELHRPLYQSQIDYDQNIVGVGMRYEIEELLHEYKVDLVLAGHYHSYLRTCDGLYQSKCENGGPTHICVGSAGASFDSTALYPQKWTDAFIKNEWGYGRITVANASFLHFEFIRAGAKNDTNAGKVRDDVWIMRDR